jgi:hypothetical protein
VRLSGAAEVFAMRARLLSVSATAANEVSGRDFMRALAASNLSAVRYDGVGNEVVCWATKLDTGRGDLTDAAGVLASHCIPANTRRKLASIPHFLFSLFANTLNISGSITESEWAEQRILSNDNNDTMQLTLVESDKLRMVSQFYS